MEQAQLKQLQDLQLNLKKDEEHLDYQDLAVDDRLKDMRQKSIDKFMETTLGVKPREKTWINLVR